MKKRFWLIVLLVLMLSVPLAAVGAQGDTVVQIYFPIAVDSPITEILNNYADTYMADHPGVQIQWSFEGGYSDVMNRLLTVKEGGGDLPALARPAVQEQFSTL